MPTKVFFLVVENILPQRDNERLLGLRKRSRNVFKGTLQVSLSTMWDTWSKAIRVTENSPHLLSHTHNPPNVHRNCPKAGPSSFSERNLFFGIRVHSHSQPSPCGLLSFRPSNSGPVSGPSLFKQELTLLYQNIPNRPPNTLYFEFSDFILNTCVIFV